MPDLHEQSSRPEWRSAQHRLRNDFQTLSALVNLSRRRISDTALIDLMPQWLGVLAALYDVHPPWSERATVSLHSIATALCGRCPLPTAVTITGDTACGVRACSAFAAAVGAFGLLVFSCRNAAPESTVSVGVRSVEDAARLAATFRHADAALRGWPPVSLSLAADAMNGRIAAEQTADNTVATLVIPRV